MPCYHSQNLDSFLKENKELDFLAKITMIKSLCKAVQYLQKLEVIQLDIKPANCVFKSADSHESET